MPRTKPWTVRDEFWERVEPLVPEAPSHARGGRPRISECKAFEAMVYVLGTGIQWNALPREEMGATSSTVHERFQEWERAGFFEELWRAGLVEYEEMEGIEWEWQAVDGVMTKKAPLGRAATGPNPTDRAKKGVKRSLLTDGSGIPLWRWWSMEPIAPTRSCYSWQPSMGSWWLVGHPLVAPTAQGGCRAASVLGAILS